MFDSEGNLMPGVVSPGASYEQQQAELADRLVEQGMPPGEAVEVAEQHFAVAIGIRDGAAREYVQAEANDDARQAIDAFEPGSSEGTQLAAGPSEIGSDAGGDTEISPRRTLLAQRLQQLTEVDSTFLVERNQAFVRAQIDRYQQLEAQAAESGDAALLRNLREERQLFESTLARLDVRLVEVDYGVAALRYADRLSARSDNSGFSRQDILQATQRLVAGTSIPGNPVDDYVRTSMAADDVRLLLTIMGGGSIGALVGQDGTGSGAPRLQRVPNGSVRVPSSGYRYNFDG